MESFGPWLRRQLKERRLSQDRFAELVGVSQQRVSGWINGAHPRASSVAAIARALEVPAEAVLSRLPVDADPEPQEAPKGRPGLEEEVRELRAAVEELRSRMDDRQPPVVEEAG